MQGLKLLLMKSPLYNKGVQVREKTVKTICNRGRVGNLAEQSLIGMIVVRFKWIETLKKTCPTRLQQQEVAHFLSPILTFRFSIKLFTTLNSALLAIFSSRRFIVFQIHRLFFLLSYFRGFSWLLGFSLA